MTILQDYLLCPECKGDLQKRNNCLHCQNCSTEFEYKWDIPVFSKNKDFYYCPTKKDWLTEKLDDYYEKINNNPTQWESLLQEILAQIPDNKSKIEWVENLVDESRSVYKYLTSLKPDSHVLNFGSGWDNTTINLARTAKKVTAYDLTKQRIQTLALKKKYYGLDNIDLFCGGDRKHLPFKDNTFDTIFINGVLEWVASDWSEIEQEYQNHNKIHKFVSYLKKVYGSHNPREIQKRFLKEMQRVLKDDGEMYIGIENRYSRLYFGKRPDHHSFIWFGSLYPRFIAHLVSMIKSHRPYTTYTYSVNGMTKLVHEAGFDKNICFGLEPMYRTPHNIFNIDNKNEIEFQRKEKKSFSHSIPNWLYKNTIASYGFIASSKKPISWIESVTEDFLIKLDVDPQEYRVKTVRSNRKEKLSIFVEKKNNKDIFYVIKVPITKKIVQVIENNFEHLQNIHKKIADTPAIKNLQEIIPRAILASEYNGQKYYAETGCCGVALISDSALDANLLQKLPKIFNLFNQINITGNSKELLVSEYEMKLSFLSKLLITSEQKKMFEDFKLQTITSIQNANGNTYLRKSDFSMSNILVDGINVCGIIDFDEASVSPFKSKNFTEFVLSYSRNRDNIFWIEAMTAIQNNKLNLFSANLKIEKTLEYLHTDLNDMKGAVRLAWLNHVYYMAQIESGRYAKQRLLPLFHNVLENISGTQ